MPSPIPTQPRFSILVDEVVDVQTFATSYRARIFECGCLIRELPSRPSYGAARRLALVRLAAIEDARRYPVQTSKTAKIA